MPGTTIAVSNTGPLISAFQSNSFPLLTRLFAQVHVPAGCVAELQGHGWAGEVRAAQPPLVTVTLTAAEGRHARSVARQIGQHSDSSIADPLIHSGEAEAIVLALRPDYASGLLLLDELAARSVAKPLGIRLSGFPGALLLAVQCGLISADDLKQRLENCRRQGTHYGAELVRQVSDLAKQGQPKT